MKPRPADQGGRFLGRSAVPRGGRGLDRWTAFPKCRRHLRSPTWCPGSSSLPRHNDTMAPSPCHGHPHTHSSPHFRELCSPSAKSHLGKKRIHSPHRGALSPGTSHLLCTGSVLFLTYTKFRSWPANRITGKLAPEPGNSCPPPILLSFLLRQPEPSA